MEWQLGTGAQNIIDIEAGCTRPQTAADICASLILAESGDDFNYLKRIKPCQLGGAFI
jgi:hypothetical protein